MTAVGYMEFVPEIRATCAMVNLLSLRWNSANVAAYARIVYLNDLITDDDRDTWIVEHTIFWKKRNKSRSVSGIVLFQRLYD